MTDRVPASPTGFRPYNNVLLSVFAVLSVVGLWYMRIGLVLADAPVGFLDVVQSGAHPNGVPIKKNYTGLGLLDEGISFLVTAFMPGAAGWNETFYWQQVHFLLQFGVMGAIMNVEACRERNRGSVLKYTFAWAFVYQNVGAAIVLSLWTLLLHRVSGPNAYFQSGRTVPVQYARLILPSTIIIYLLPTLATFYPRFSNDTLQSVLAFWQFAPLLVNIPLWFAAPFVSSAPATGKAKTADLKHLHVLYYALFFFSLASHWYSVFMVMSSETEGVTLSRVFLPHRAHWLTSMDNGLLWIFQWDWIIIATSFVVTAMIGAYDVQRFVPEIDTDSDRLGKIVYIAVALVALGGPGASLAAYWGFREEQLAVMEERVEKRDEKKAN